MKMSVFEKTYRDYLHRIGQIDLQAVAGPLGIEAEKGLVFIRLFSKEYRVSGEGILDSGGQRPDLDVCVVLSRYLLMCPGETPEGEKWFSFRDFKDTGPLTVYFKNEVERAVERIFSGDLPHLKEASRALGGKKTGIEAAYDLAVRFDALPRVPLLLIFNDGDEEFPSKCSVLFKETAESYLDGECLAILGKLLFTSLQSASM